MQILKIIIAILCLIISLTEAASYNATHKVYLEVKIHRKHLGRIVLALFGDDAPRTVENFRQICVNGIDGKTYAGSKFHRVVQRFMIQGGDIVSGDGRGSVSIYGDYFEDENMSIEHSGSGFLGMANRGPNTNGCQFYITTMATPWLNGKHTVFGKVIDGEGVVHTIEKTKTDTDDRPVKNVIITECGEIPVNGKFVVSDEIYGIWNWIQAAGVPVGMSFTILSIFHYFIRKLNVLT